MPDRTTTITSLDNPRVKRVVRLRNHRERRTTGLFIAEGEREVSRAIAAGLPLVELYLCPSRLGAAAERWRAVDAVARYEVTEPVFTKLTYLDDPQGILGVFEQPRWSLDAATATPDALWLVAVGLHKPGNLGAIARSAAAAGATGLLIADAVVDAFNPNAVRASTGAVFTLPIIGETSQALIQLLDERRIRRVVTIAGEAAPYTQVDLTGPTAIVIGAEDVGVPDSWLLGDADLVTRVTIPMCTAAVDSLNASVAAGVMLFEAARQRGGAN